MTLSKSFLWKFNKSTAHGGPLTSSDPSWKRSNYNVMIRLENGEVTTEQLSIIADDSPVESAIHANNNNLLGSDSALLTTCSSRCYTLLIKPS